MTPDELMALHRVDWERLSELTKRAQSGRLGGLNESEIVEFGRLYRSATSDLAIAQRDFPRHGLALYLNQLVGRAHPLIYRGEPIIWRHLKEFYRRGFPQLYRELGPFILAAALLLFVPMILGYIAMLVNPDAAIYLVPAGTIRQVKEGDEWWRQLNNIRSMGSVLLMTNNLGVAFQAFAGGVFFGLFTVYVLIMNGLVNGMVLGLVQAYGHGTILLEFIIGHGVLELSEVTMAGGSGLMLGYALLHPGLLSRKDALVLAAQKAVRLLLGSAPLLIVAGLIEGLISPSYAPALLKVAIGLMTGILLYSYLLLAGRDKPRRRGSV